MAKLALSRDLLTEFARLEKRAQSRVSELADKFQRMTAQELRSAKGIHLESYNNGRDPRAKTIRIDSNHRGVVIDIGDDETYVLTHIGTHDQIDRWMMQNVSRVNEVTGAFEIVNVVAIEEAVEDTQNRAGQNAGATPIFAHRPEKDFRQLGVDLDLLPVLRVITSEEQLEALLKPLPQSQAEALICLTGNEPVDVLFGQIAGDVDPDSVDTTDLAAALTAPASRSQFHVLTSEGELADMLALPLAQWRTYLHTPNTNWLTDRSTTDQCGSPEARAPARPSWRCTEQRHWPINFQTRRVARRSSSLPSPETCPKSSSATYACSAAETCSSTSRSSTSIDWPIASSKKPRELSPE